MLKSMLIALLFVLSLSFAACGGEEAPSDQEADQESALRNDCGCCGDVCCMKGGTWQLQGGMMMCCRTAKTGNQECINDPSAWTRVLPPGDLPVFTSSP